MIPAPRQLFTPDKRPCRIQWGVLAREPVLVLFAETIKFWRTIRAVRCAFIISAKSLSSVERVSAHLMRRAFRRRRFRCKNSFRYHRLFGCHQPSSTHLGGSGPKPKRRVVIATGWGEPTGRADLAPARRAHRSVTPPSPRCAGERANHVQSRPCSSKNEVVAPRHGFEPRFTAPKAAVLLLDDRGNRVGTTSLILVSQLPASVRSREESAL